MSGRYGRGSGGKLGYLALPVFGQGLRRTFPDVVTVRKDFHRPELLGKAGRFSNGSFGQGLRRTFPECMDIWLVRSGPGVKRLDFFKLFR